MSKVKFDNRFFGLLIAVIVMLGIVPSTTVMANSISDATIDTNLSTSLLAIDYSTGGWDMLEYGSDIYNESGRVQAFLERSECVTIISAGNGRDAYIEYNTLDGPERGYINKYQLTYGGHYEGSAYGIVASSGSTYYSDNYNFYAGSVSTGESVAVLCDNGSWAYIEYNISGGLRKRAFIPSYRLTTYSDAQNFFYHEGDDYGLMNISETKPVYAGPNGVLFPVCGEVYPSDSNDTIKYLFFYDADGDALWYVRYPVGNQYKYGYVYE